MNIVFYTYLSLINALSYLEMKRRPFLSMDNLIIYLKRDFDVPKENIRKIRIMKHEPEKWVPVEIN